MRDIWVVDGDFIALIFGCFGRRICAPRAYLYCYKTRQSKTAQTCLSGGFWSALDLVVEWISGAARGFCAPVAAWDIVGAPGQVKFVG